MPSSGAHPVPLSWQTDSLLSASYLLNIFETCFHPVITSPSLALSAATSLPAQGRNPGALVESPDLNFLLRSISFGQWDFSHWILTALWFICKEVKCHGSLKGEKCHELVRSWSWHPPELRLSLPWGGAAARRPPRELSLLVSCQSLSVYNRLYHPHFSVSFLLPLVVSMV